MESYATPVAHQGDIRRRFLHRYEELGEAWTRTKSDAPQARIKANRLVIGQTPNAFLF
jgi:hypothetical protein